MIPAKQLYKESKYYHSMQEIEDIMNGKQKIIIEGETKFNDLKIYYRDIYNHSNFGIQHYISGTAEDGFTVFYLHFYGDCGKIVRHSYMQNKTPNFEIQEWEDAKEHTMLSKDFLCYSLKCRYKNTDSEKPFQRIMFEVEFDNPSGNQYLTEKPYILTVEVSLNETAGTTFTKYYNSFLSKECVPYQTFQKIEEEKPKEEKHLMIKDKDNWLTIETDGHKYNPLSINNNNNLEIEKFIYTLKNPWLEQNWYKGQLGYAVYVFPKNDSPKTKQNCLGRGELPLIEYYRDDAGILKVLQECSTQQVLDYLFNGKSALENQYIGHSDTYSLLNFTYVDKNGDSRHLALGDDYSIFLTPIWGVELDDLESTYILQYGRNYIRSYDIIESLGKQDVFTDEHGLSIDIGIPDQILDAASMNITGLSMYDFWWYGEIFWEAPKKNATDPTNVDYSFSVEYSFGKKDGEYLINYINDNVMSYVKPNDGTVLMGQVDRSITLNGMDKIIQDTSCSLTGYINIYTKVIDKDSGNVYRTTRSGMSFHFDDYFKIINNKRVPYKQGPPQKRYIRPWDINSKIKEADIANHATPADEVKVVNVTNDMITLQMPFRSFMGLPSRYFSYKVQLKIDDTLYDGTLIEAESEDFLLDSKGVNVIVKDNLDPAPATDAVFKFEGVEDDILTMQSKTVETIVTVIPINLTEDMKIEYIEDENTYYQQKISSEQVFGALDINEIVSSIELDLMKTNYIYSYGEGVVTRKTAEVRDYQYKIPAKKGYETKTVKTGKGQFKIDTISITPTNELIWRQNDFFLDICHGGRYHYYIPTKDLILSSPEVILIKLGGIANNGVYYQDGNISITLKSVKDRQSSPNNIYYVKNIGNIKEGPNTLTVGKELKDLYQKIIADGIQIYWDEYEEARKRDSYSPYSWNALRSNVFMANRVFFKGQYKNGDFVVIEDNHKTLYTEYRPYLFKNLSVFDDYYYINDVKANPSATQKIFTSKSIDDFTGLTIAEDNRRFFNIGENNIIPGKEQYPYQDRLVPIQCMRFSLDENKYVSYKISAFPRVSLWEQISSNYYVVAPLSNIEILWENDMASFEGIPLESLFNDYEYKNCSFSNNKRALCIDIRDGAGVAEVLREASSPDSKVIFQFYNENDGTSTVATPLQKNNEYIIRENVGTEEEPEYRQRIYFDLTSYFGTFKAGEVKVKSTPTHFRIGYMGIPTDDVSRERALQFIPVVSIDISQKITFLSALFNNSFVDTEYHFYDFDVKMFSGFKLRLSLHKPENFNNTKILDIDVDFNDYFLGFRNNTSQYQRCTIIREDINGKDGNYHNGKYAYDNYGIEYVVYWGDDLILEKSSQVEYYSGQDILNNVYDVDIQITPGTLFKGVYYGVFCENDATDPDRNGKYTAGNYVRNLPSKTKFKINLDKPSEDAVDFVLMNSFFDNHMILPGAFWFDYTPTTDWGVRQYFSEENVFYLHSFNENGVRIEVSTDPTYDINNSHNSVVLYPIKEEEKDGVRVYINEETHNLSLDNIKVQKIVLSHKQKTDTIIDFVIDTKDIENDTDKKEEDNGNN